MDGNLTSGLAGGGPLLGRGFGLRACGINGEWRLIAGISDCYPTVRTVNYARVTACLNLFLNKCR